MIHDHRVFIEVLADLSHEADAKHGCIETQGLVQELLGHADLSTTVIYAHVFHKGAGGVASPLDR